MGLWLLVGHAVFPGLGGQMGISLYPDFYWGYIEVQVSKYGDTTVVTWTTSVTHNPGVLVHDLTQAGEFG